MSDSVREDGWEYATWEGARKLALERSLAATPAQRLAWLEEMLEIAFRAGALDPKPPNTTRSRALSCSV